MNQSSWSVKAKNLPEHSRNPIHTDEGGRAAGFDGALVAGVTVYAYLTNPIVKLWGVDWLRRGSSIIEFKSPVLANQLVECVTVLEEDSLEVHATVEDDVVMNGCVHALVVEAQDTRLVPIVSFHSAHEVRDDVVAIFELN